MDSGRLLRLIDLTPSAAKRQQEREVAPAFFLPAALTSAPTQTFPFQVPPRSNNVPRSSQLCARLRRTR